MLDQHPRLAIPPESHFVVDLAPPHRLGRLVGDPTLDDILSHWNVKRRWTFDDDALEGLRERERRLSYPDLVAGVFDAYAAARGKPRWGDKTPPYVNHLATLDRLFPDARYVHVIRDGRDVAASMIDQPWGVPHVTVAAFKWRRSIRRARRVARRLGDRYLEVRLEDLIEEPERRLREICQFLGEDYDPALLAYHERVPGTREFSHLGPGFRHLASPPTAGLRDWTEDLTARERRAVEAICAGALRDLGYSPPTVSLRAHVDASMWLGRHLPLQVVRTAVRPMRRWTSRAWTRFRGRGDGDQDQPDGEDAA